MVLNPGEEHPHGVRPVVEEGDASTIQVIGQLVDIRLQLCKGYGQTKNQGRCFTSPQAPRPPLKVRLKCWLCWLTGWENLGNYCTCLCLSFPSPNTGTKPLCFSESSQD